MFYSKVGREELQIVRIRDASFKTDEETLMGKILFLVSKDFTKASLIYWESKQIERV